MTDKNRKMSRRSFGGYKLISVKDEGGKWEGLIWVKAKSLKAFDKFYDESPSKADEIVLSKCPKDVPMMCFPADGYPMVRSECKDCYDMEGNEGGNCPFLLRYADDGFYGCRLRVKDAGDRVYRKDIWG